MKTCSHCHRKLDQSEFNWKKKHIKKSYQCKQCSRAYVKAHYRMNTQYYLWKARKRSQFVREKMYSYIGQYLSVHPCVDCGETDILVLEFDHKDRANKIQEISNIVKRQLTFDTLVSEIEKCDVRCANCHRKKTLTENKCWKINFAPVA